MSAIMVVAVGVVDGEDVVWQYEKKEVLPMGPDEKENLRMAAARIRAEITAAEEAIIEQITATTRNAS